MGTLFLAINNLNAEEMEKFTQEAYKKNMSREDLAEEIIRLYIKTGEDSYKENHA